MNRSTGTAMKGGAWWLLAMAAAAAAMLSACGGSSPQASATASTGLQTPKVQGASSRCTYPGAVSCFKVTLSMSGAQSFRGTAEVPNKQTCESVLAQNAAGNAGEVSLQATLMGTDGATSTLSVNLDQYSGPGAYTQASNNVYVDILAGASEFNPQSSTGATTITASASADGSVSVAFANLGAAAGSDTISGQADFACVNA